MPNIAIVWDFDGTLTPLVSTSKVVEILGDSPDDFWAYVKSLRGDKKLPKWEHILASDAPIWMYSLSRLAFSKGIPLNREFFEAFVKPHIHLYDEVPRLLRRIKLLQDTKRFRSVDLKIHHFVITAGLKDLVEQMLPEGLVTWTFGCRYQVVVDQRRNEPPESVPVFCMDETMKTRSLFEISKGSFRDKNHSVNRRVTAEDRWAPFENIIYLGDGDTDVPALSLVRNHGGIGIAVYDPKKPKSEVDKRLRDMRLDRRADLITPADFSDKGELFEYLNNRCVQIYQRYRAERSVGGL